MADEQDRNDQQDSDDTQPGGNPGSAGNTSGPLTPESRRQEQQQGVTFTTAQQEYLNKLLADERRTALQKFKTSDEYKSLSASAQRTNELEAETRQRIDDLAAENARLKAERAGAVSKAEAALARAQFVAVASQRGIPSERIQDASLLADKSSVTVNLDDGTVTGVEESVQRLIESRPWLVGPGIAPRHTMAERPAPNLNSGAQGQPATDEGRIAQAMQEMAARGIGRL